MKAQFKSLQAARVNNVAAQSSVQQLQQATAQPTIDNFQNTNSYAVELQKKQKEINELKKENAALLTLNQCTSKELQYKIQTMNQQNTSLSTQVSQSKEEMVKLQKSITLLRLQIKVLQAKEKQLTESNANNLDSLVKSKSLLMQIIENKDKEIAALKNELSNSQVIPSEISAIDAIEQDNVQHVQPINLNNLQTVESILIENSNPNISQQQIDVSYGEPILNQHGQPILGGEQAQLMGDSSQDFSIIDHQD